MDDTQKIPVSAKELKQNEFLLLNCRCDYVVDAGENYRIPAADCPIHDGADYWPEGYWKTGPVR